MSETWRTLTHTPALTHPYVRVTLDAVQLPNGRIIPDWPTIHLPAFANVLVINGQRQALLVEGYKHGPGQTTWQVPGGLLEPEEEPLAAIQRELLEETGYHCTQWRALGSFVVDANRGCGVGHFFLAWEARQVATPQSGDLEAMRLFWTPVATLPQALLEGRIGVMSHACNVALSLAALPWVGI